MYRIKLYFTTIKKSSKIKRVLWHQKETNIRQNGYTKRIGKAPRGGVRHRGPRKINTKRKIDELVGVPLFENAE